MSSIGNKIFQNLANITSLLGVLPLCLLLTAEGFRYLPALIVYNNVMDDLDGILAIKLGIKSRFGALLDNICDTAAHVLILMSVGASHGTVTLVLCTIPVAAILLRVASRVNPTPGGSSGTPTNELMRHMLFIILLSRTYGFDPTWVLAAAFLLNSVSMLVPFAMPHLVRSRATTATSIAMVNVALLVAWLVPHAVTVIAIPFFGTYLYSFLYGARKHS